MKFCPECFAEYADDATSCPVDGASLAGADLDALVGTTLSNRYKILSVIGKGGMGVVYKARHDHLDRIVAIKMLHSHLVSETEAIKRFHREAKAVSRIKHPHTVSLYDFGISESGQPFIVMDYIEGISLKKILRDNGPVSLERAQHIFAQVADALACAHSEGVIHRDLKPENIMLSRRGEDGDFVEVVDFGISKLKGKDNQTVDNITKIGDVCGSPPYMSPEQCLASAPVDARSDVYSLAIVLYEAISGRLPFKARTAIEMIDCHLYSNPTPLKAAHEELTCCEALTALLSKALSKEPEKRQSSMQEFAEEMADAIRRDAIKLRSFRNLSQALAMEAALNEAEERGDSTMAGPREAVEAVRQQQVTARLGEPQRRNQGGFFGGIVNGFLALIGRAPGPADTDRPYVLANCPYCGSDTQPNIRFCLDCGRTLPNPQELTRLRSAQGVFHYPKSQRGQTEAPELSNRARKALSKVGGAGGRIFILLNLLLLLLICIFYFGMNEEGKRTASVEEGNSAQKSPKEPDKPVGKQAARNKSKARSN